MKEYKFKESYRARIGKTADGKDKWKRFTGYSNTSKAKAKKNAKEEADAWIAAHKHDEIHDVLTLGTAYDEYISSKGNILSPATIRGYAILRRNSLQDLMPRDIYTITQVDVQRAVNQEAKTKSPKTIRNIHGLLCAVMTMYRPDFVLHTTLPSKMPTELHVPTNEEIERLLTHTKESDADLYAAILLAAFGSLRRSEICALTLSDFTKTTVSVTKAKVPDQNNHYVVKNKTKSAAGTRVITLPDKVISVIRCLGRDKYVFDMTPNSLSIRFSRALRAAGIPHFRFHDLRHYQASILHAMGVPDKYIMERGGWKTDSTLKNVYQHTMDDKRKEVENQICDYFSDSFL